MSAIRCRGLIKRYGAVTAVDGLDLEVAAGECFGLLGPNGAGKTTTMEILAGMVAATAGEVEVLGRSWGRDGVALRARIGVALQETRLAERLTVAETVTLFASFYRGGRGPDEALREVGLEDRPRVQVGALSGGQRQRLTIACALVGDPELVFLDEPTAGLDPISRRQLWALVDRLTQRGRTVLLTTHDMDEAAQLCGRLAIVDHGRVIATGTPAELIAGLAAPAVRRAATLEDVFVALTGRTLDVA